MPAAASAIPVGIMFRISLFISLICVLNHSEGSLRYFWHITDVHVDPYYWSDYEMNSCNKILESRGVYGDYECDSPYELLQSAVKAMMDNGREPEFIIYSGDTPGHLKNYTHFNQSVIVDILSNITALFNASFPQANFVMVLGNHDYFPKNELPGHVNSIYEAAANLWRPWLGNSQENVDTFKKGAYYTHLVNPEKKIRVVVANTHLYATNNPATVGDNDPGEQYTWLESTLTAARNNKEKVHLIIHTPPGVMPVSSGLHWLHGEDNTRLSDYIRQFSDIIIGTYAGHEHFDTFRIIYDEGIPVGTIFLAPSVTPWRSRVNEDIQGMAHNPGIRKVLFDDEDGYLDNIEQFYLDLPKANQDKDANWLRLYTFKGLYTAVDNLTASTLHQLIESFKDYGSNEFHKYYDHYSVLAQHSSNLPCSCACKYTHICSMQSMDYDAFDMCYEHITCGGIIQIGSVSLIIYSLILLLATV